MPTTTTRRCGPLAASLVALTLTAALAACGDDDDRSDRSDTTNTTDSSDPTSTPIAAPAATIPDTPVGEQLRWALEHLAPGGQPPTVEEINEHVSAEFLRDVMPAETVIGIFGQTVAERGGLDFVEFAFEPRPEAGVAVVRTRSGEEAALFLKVESQPPHRIEAIEIDDVPAEPLATSGAHSGLFAVNGRQLFLSCVGDGEPSVVLVGGLTSDWTEVQQPASATTRVCSYDKPNVPGSRSEDAGTPRDSAGMAGELAALLEAAAVPDPYVIVGHSDGGMVAQLFAAAQPDRIAGIVIVDSAHEDQDLRAAELARSQLPPEEAEAVIAGMTAKLPRLVDREQLDYVLSRDQLRASRTTAPLPAVPMTVLVHDLPLEGVPPQLAEPYEPLWQEMQRQVAALVPGASYQVVVGTTHDIHGDRPDVVADAIIDIVAGARDQRD
jgi:pimeloyl-ACP methyl ester carboxylesterase